MTIKDFINTELLAIAKKAIQYHAEASDKVIKELSSLDLSDIDVLKEFVNSEALSDSNNLFFRFKDSVEAIIKLNEPEGYLEILSKIESMIKSDKTNKIYPLLWIQSKLYYFRHDEYLDSEYKDFLENVFDKYPDFVKDEELFNDLKIILIPKSKDWNPDIFKELFNGAAEKFPENTKIRWIAGQISYRIHEYENALSHVKEIYDIHKNNKWPDKRYDPYRNTFTYYDFIDIVQTMGIINSLTGNTNEAMKNAGFVLNNLPDFDFPLPQELFSKIHFMDSYFVRMRCNMLSENIEEVMNDYNDVKNFLKFSDWKEWYADVMDFIYEIEDDFSIN